MGKWSKIQVELFIMLLFAVLHNALFVYFNNPGGLTLDKVMLGISFLYFLKIAFANKLSSNAGLNTKYLLYLFFFYCLFTFGRGVLTGLQQHRVQNALNPIFGMGLIVPFGILIAFHPKFSFDVLYRVLMVFTKIGVCLFPLTIINYDWLFLQIPLMAGSFFLLIFLGVVQSKKDKVWIILGCINYCYLGFLADSRTAILRLLLQVAFLFVFIYGERMVGKRIIKKLVLVFIVALPLLIYQSYDSFFKEQSVAVGDSQLSNEDTRTFLYKEVIADLENTRSMTFGKGSLGTYFSPMFFDQMGLDDEVDFADRSNIEVGVLSYLLRGGLVLVIIFVFVLLKSSTGPLGSQDPVSRGISYIIFNHLLISVVENIPRYFVYDLIFWILVGYNLRKTFYYQPVVEPGARHGLPVFG